MHLYALIHSLENIGSLRGNQENVGNIFSLLKMNPLSLHSIAMSEIISYVPMC